MTDELDYTPRRTNGQSLTKVVKYTFAMPEIKAAFLDIDHTLINGTGELHEGLAEVLGPGNRPYKLTHLTARAPMTYARILLCNPDIAPSPDMPIGLEYGTRVVYTDDYGQPESYETISRSPLSSNELAAIVVAACLYADTTRVAFTSKTNNGARIVWHSGNASVGELESLLDLHRPGLVSYRLPHGRRHPEQFDSLRTYKHSYNNATTVDILPSNAGKRQGALRMMELCGFSPSEVLIAGDSPADYGMLAIKGVRALLVHSEKTDLSTVPRGLIPVPADKIAQLLMCHTPSKMCPLSLSRGSTT